MQLRWHGVLTLFRNEETLRASSLYKNLSDFFQRKEFLLDAVEEDASGIVDRIVEY